MYTNALVSPACTRSMPAYIKALVALQNKKRFGQRTELIDFPWKRKTERSRKLSVWIYPEKSKTEGRSRRSKKSIRKVTRSKKSIMSLSYLSCNIHYTLHCRICRVSRQSSVISHVMYCMQVVCCVVCQFVSFIMGIISPSPAIAVLQQGHPFVHSASSRCSRQRQ